MTYTSSLSNLCEVNSSFDAGILQVAYEGKNRNGSFISKESFERSIKTIYNCPIVCNYDRETNSIGAHDILLVRDENDTLQMVNATTPVGVVPESARYFWREITEDDGSVHNYLCVDVLLWKRQEAYKKIKEDGITAESMEISVKDGRMQDGFFVIDDFEFTAFCLLGSAEPCFESASLAMFSMDSFEQQYEEMMQDFKAAFSLVQSSSTGVDIYTNQSEGGEILDDKKNLMAEFGLTEEDIDFSLEDFDIDELREKFAAIASGNDGHEGDPTPPTGEESFELAGQFLSELRSALGAEKIETEYGVYSRYCFEDYDADKSMVYCYDANDWLLYGFSYSMNGDNVVIDFSSKKRMKFSIVEFDEGEQPSPFAPVFEMVTQAYKDNDAQWKEKYQTLTEQINTANSELESLHQYKADHENAEARAEREGVLNSFSDLTGIEAYDALCSECDNYTAEELEEKCFAIRGRTQTQKFNLQSPKAPKLPVGKSVTPESDPYGGLFAKFGVTPPNKN